jgi:hypothetical protein
MSNHPDNSFHLAVQEFVAHSQRDDGTQIVAGLMAGLDRLAVLMVDRIATEPEMKFGVDSMIMPRMVVSGHVAAGLEIELFQVVESAAAARNGGYISASDDWYLRWLAKTRLPERYLEPAVIARLAVYRAKPSDGRRLAFETAIDRALPQAVRAPVVLYRLFPMAIEIATAIAFDDAEGAQAARKRQIEVLANLADCHACHGSLLDNGEECRQCGNPLWKFDWLTAE